MFFAHIGPKYLTTYNGFMFEHDGDKDILSKVIEQFDRGYAKGEINESYERYIFNQRDQKSGELFDDFLASLRSLSETCNFCSCLKQSLIRDRIIAGIENPATRKKLLQDRNLSLKKCIDICRSAETTDRQLKTFQSEANIHGVSRVRSWTRIRESIRVKIHAKFHLRESMWIRDKKNLKNSKTRLSNFGPKICSNFATFPGKLTYFALGSHTIISGNFPVISEVFFGYNMKKRRQITQGNCRSDIFSSKFCSRDTRMTVLFVRYWSYNTISVTNEARFSLTNLFLTSLG